MLIALAVLAVLAVLLAAGVLATSERPVLSEVSADGPDFLLPQGQLQPEDVPELRFGLALRGYRMAEVDTALERVRTELIGRDARITELERALSDSYRVEPQRPEVGATPFLTAPAVEPAEAPWPEEHWPEIAPVTTSAVAPGPDAGHAPLELFPEVTPPDAPVSSFGLFADVNAEESPEETSEVIDNLTRDDLLEGLPPLGRPGEGLATSGGAVADAV